MKIPDEFGRHLMDRVPKAPLGIDPKFQASWALYFSKFITAYKGHGIPFWGLTPQNEPMFAAPWEACSYNETNQADFVAEHLGPQMKKDHPDVKIMVFDHNRDAVDRWGHCRVRQGQRVCRRRGLSLVQRRRDESWTGVPSSTRT